MSIFRTSEKDAIDDLSSVYKNGDSAYIYLSNGKNILFTKLKKDKTIDKSKYRFIQISNGIIKEISDIQGKPDIVGQDMEDMESVKHLMKEPGFKYPKMYLFHGTGNMDLILKNGWLKSSKYLPNIISAKGYGVGDDSLVFMMTTPDISLVPEFSDFIVFESKIFLNREFFTNNTWNYGIVINGINKINQEAANTKRYKSSNINEINKILFDLWVNAGYDFVGDQEIMIRDSISLKDSYRIVKGGKIIDNFGLDKSTYVEDPALNNISNIINDIDPDNIDPDDIKTMPKCSKEQSLCNHATENRYICCNKKNCTECMKI